MRAAPISALLLCQVLMLASASEGEDLSEIARLLAEGHEHDDEHLHDHEHEHEHEPWEWSAIFELAAGEIYTWSAARGSDGAYASNEMKLVIAPLGDEDGLDVVASAAKELLAGPEEAWANKTSGDVLALGSGGGLASALRLQLDEAAWLSLFHFEVASSGRFAFFAQHLPSDFESGFHFFKDERGEDIVPVDVLSAHADSHSTPETEQGGNLGLAVAASIIVSLPALFMIALVGPAVQRMDVRAFPVMNAFASGAVFSCAAFLLMPEGMLLAAVGVDEAAGSAIWGSALLGGWLLGVLIHHISSIAPSSLGTVSSQPEVQDAEAASPQEDQVDSRDGKAVTRSKSLQGMSASIAPAVLLGDFFHNLVDGMVVGFSARACSTSALWVVIIATVLHEIPQEIADFIVLLTKANMSWRKATFLNFLAACPASLFGAILAHEADMSETMQGVFLGFSSGVYLFVAVTELGPSVLQLTKPFVLNSVLRVLAFVLGAVLIGLVLLGHEHCGHEDGGGHSHSH